MTKPKRYKRYSAEFKQEALRRAAEEGMTDKAVCEELGISTRQFRRWHGEMMGLNDVILAFSPEVFAVKAWTHFQPQGNGCEFVHRVPKRDVSFPAQEP